ncbi:CCA-adding enzyme [Streptococcus sanguinis]|uniref:CCA-adding enzyme n=2 Tax=Streptococcus sanguinis TaxID=1305 RepID=F0IUQ5_STRSA|nr:CCA tRNA nucleotidyltransferase [Streptococcus sanguinis]EGD31784.1 polyA polymerase family protein [Streptococcus sanguinis SK115]EGD38310.1 polyA polymerase family protein [Streptococcus sanguinis SK160]MBZ2052264.1 CCA tRNA nucleotidyltransferase [Streptococcus sanguinis]MCY7032145.1 CCA tRNA nucleotidyltransferase [Streptococcus sanguinis]RSI28031.1 CCA-adding enzyme [Streptococcus sanguinis]
MRLETLPSEFQEALPVLEKIKAAGFEAYFVGGSVRDALLKRPIHDVDIASSSYPEETKHIFDRTVDVGIEHGTVLVLENNREYEVTTFRTEDVYVDYRRPSKVSFVRSLEEDLKRRDFTINALALDENGQVIDLFQGLDDLENQILRAVGTAAERFNEDALRIMRGFRFQAALDFDLEQDTFVAMKDCAPLLEKISVERIFIEFDKLLLAPFWRKGLEALLTSGAIEFLPDLKESRAKLERLFELDSEFRFSASEQAWAALLLALDVQNVKGFLKKWKTSREFAKKVEDLVGIADIRSERDLTKRDCYDYDIDLLQQAEELRQAQGLAVDFSAIKSLDASLTIHNKQEMVVNGGMLMQEFDFEPGPKLGQILKELEYAIVDGRLPNDLEAVYAYIKEKK